MIFLTSTLKDLCRESYSFKNHNYVGLICPKHDIKLYFGV